MTILLCHGFGGNAAQITNKLAELTLTRSIL